MEYYLTKSIPINHLLLLLLLICITPPTFGNISCNQTGKDEVVRWRTEPKDFYVTWELAQVCSSSIECFGFENGYLDVQLCPLYIQEGDRVFLEPSLTPQFYKLKPTIVTIEDWLDCPSNSSDADSIQELYTGEGSDEIIEIPSQYLSAGTTYLAQSPNGVFSNCQFGLRLVIKIKPYACTENQCNGHGQCATTIEDDAYDFCDCDKDYGLVEDCSEFDACSLEPCANGGICLDVTEGLEGTSYECQCGEGFSGKEHCVFCQPFKKYQLC